MAGDRASEWADGDLVQISMLEHWSYCPRQCALIHLEQTFQENLYTMRGLAVHDKVDQPDGEMEQGIRVERAVPLWSEKLGLIGRADVVEFHGETPYPVEYKSGPRRKWGHDALQLCAQAICLEEMLGQAIPRGAIYYHGSRRRLEVFCDEELRMQVERSVCEIREMLHSNRMPPPVNDARCRECSLQEACMPAVLAERTEMANLTRGLFVSQDHP